MGAMITVTHPAIEATGQALVRTQGTAVNHLGYDIYTRISSKKRLMYCYNPGTKNWKGEDVVHSFYSVEELKRKIERETSYDLASRSPQFGTMQQIQESILCTRGSGINNGQIAPQKSDNVDTPAIEVRTNIASYPNPRISEHNRFEHRGVFGRIIKRRYSFFVLELATGRELSCHVSLSTAIERARTKVNVKHFGETEPAKKINSEERRREVELTKYKAIMAERGR
jgi:hypothetical protein